MNILDLNDDVPVEELCRQVVAADLDREDAWEGYEIISSHEDDYGDHDWYRINYRYQGKEDNNVSFCIKQVGRSEGLEYIMTAHVEESFISYYASDINHMLDSFRF